MIKASDAIVAQQLSEILTVEEQVHLRDGAHFVLDDHGFYALHWCGLPGAQKRINSHVHQGDAFSIQGTLFPEFLFSSRQINGRNYTWFQAERHGVRNLMQFVPHTVCWMLYLGTGKNYGPDGSTHYTEANPIRIEEARITGSRHQILGGLRK